MEVNVTFVFQIGNFIIAYYMLKHFLLKPLVDTVQAEDRAVQELQQAVDACKTIVKQHEQAVHNQWSDYQAAFIHAMPTIDDIRPMLRAPLMPAPVVTEVSVQEQNMITQELTKEIIARVGRAY